MLNILLLATIAFTAPALADEPDPSGIKAARLAMHQDADTFTKGGQSMVDWSKFGFQQPTFTTPQELRAAFAANEIAAEEKFQNKPIMINGNVASVSRDP